jgi:hypothetical protein
MLQEIKPSWKPGKKMVAIFSDHGPVHFGATGYMNYLKYKAKNKALAEVKRRQYIARHGAAENWKNPYAAGTLSRYILWEFEPSRAVAKYNELFF